MAEYKVTGGNVYFKNGDMVDFSHWGPVYISEPTDTENRYEVKKFDLQSGAYQHTDELTEWEGNAVTDGYYTFVPETIPEMYSPSTAEIAQMLSDLQADLIIAGVI